MCEHQPPCPNADAVDHESARVISCHPEQGWSLLCNGVIVFEDTGELLPDGTLRRSRTAARPRTSSPPPPDASEAASGPTPISGLRPHRSPRRIATRT